MSLLEPDSPINPAATHSTALAVRFDAIRDALRDVREPIRPGFGPHNCPSRRHRDELILQGLAADAFARMIEARS